MDAVKLSSTKACQNKLNQNRLRNFKWSYCEYFPNIMEIFQDFVFSDRVVQKLIKRLKTIYARNNF